LLNISLLKLECASPIKLDWEGIHDTEGKWDINQLSAETSNESAPNAWLAIELYKSHDDAHFKLNLKF
jgi:hypothetical protein